MANETLSQLYTASPTTTFVSTDLMYLSRSPYSSGTDFGFTYGSILTAILPQTVTANQTLVSTSNNSPVWSTSLPAAVQANITTVGNITTGTWNGTSIAVNKGGTGASSFSAGSVIFSNGTTFAQDNTNFVWDNSSKFLGLGTSAPATRLNVKGVISVFFNSQTIYGGISPLANTSWNYGANDSSSNIFGGGYSPSFGGGYFQINITIGQPVMQFYVRNAGTTGSASLAMSITGTSDINLGNGALVTTANTGFANISTCAGAPTGTPSPLSGMAPMVYDTTNNKLWVYSGGTWRGIVLI